MANATGSATTPTRSRQSDTGRYQVGSKDTKAAILALRKDPEVSALMAGEAAKETKQSLECLLGREVCGGELYAAHFLGQGGARRLIALNEKNPDAHADAAFPQAAKANRLRLLPFGRHPQDGGRGL